MALFATYVQFLFFYSINRFAAFLWNYDQYRADTIQEIFSAFLTGMRFDIAAVSMVAIPFFLVSCLPSSTLRRIAHFLHLWAQLLFLIMNFFDIEFMNFTARRFTYDAIFNIAEMNGKASALISTNWKLALYGLIFALFILIKSRYQLTRNGIFKHLFFLAILVVGARGGLQLKPIGFSHSQVFSKPSLNNLALNSTYTFIHSVQQTGPQKVQYFSDRPLMTSYLNSAHAEDLPRPWIEKSPNVIVFILESFSLEHMKAGNTGVSYTPFLDSLQDKSLFFTNGYANALRSIEGISSILTGIPAWMNQPFISSSFVNNQFYGVAQILKEHGYETAFFHGGKNGTMYFDQFATRSGFQRYYGMSEYPNQNDFDGVWGIPDHLFLDFMGEKIDEERASKAPFFYSIFSLSSHHPFSIPAGFKGKFPIGTHPIHQTVGYTDQALKTFFEKNKDKEWFKNTLFIFTADHTFQAQTELFKNGKGMFQIPIIFYYPMWQEEKNLKAFGDLKLQVDSQIAQQIDIPETIFDFLSLKPKYRNYLGRSLLKSVPDAYSIHYLNGRYGLINRQYYIESNEKMELSFYSFTYPLQKIESLPMPDQVKWTEVLKANVQYFSEGLWDNKLYY